MITFVRRLRTFVSDLMLVPAMWRYLVAVARQDRATDEALKQYRGIAGEASVPTVSITLGLASLSREVRRT